MEIIGIPVFGQSGGISVVKYEIGRGNKSLQPFVNVGRNIDHRCVRDGFLILPHMDGHGNPHAQKLGAVSQMAFQQGMGLGRQRLKIFV